MKSLTIFVTVAIVIVIIVAALMVFRSTQESALPLEDYSLEEQSGDSLNADNNLNQFLQEEPTDGPPVLTVSGTPGVSPSPTTSSVANEGVTISMTDTGFSPSKITIPAGTTVTFTNNGQALHWPASAVHPTHQLLPGFNAKRGLSTGESYAFTFTKAGDWPIHDHLNPSSTGTITVQ